MDTLLQNHIRVDERGIAYVAGTRIKVQNVAIQKTYWKQSPEEIQQAYPHLSLGQIYAALSYYCDNQEKVDAEICEDERRVDELASQQTGPTVRERIAERMRQQQAASNAG